MSEKKNITTAVQVPTIEERLANLEKNFGQFIVDVVLAQTPRRPNPPRFRPAVQALTDVLLALAYVAVCTYFFLEIRRRYFQDSRGRRA